VTDVTGFGLMGHGRELALGSGVTIEIETEKVLRINGALDAIALGTIPAGLLANKEFAECVITDAEGARIGDDLRNLLYDPQTAGGLLISLAPESADPLLQALREAGLKSSRIGTVFGPYKAGQGRPAIVLR
jgi:selenide,water dikinase